MSQDKMGGLAANKGMYLWVTVVVLVLLHLSSCSSSRPPIKPTFSIPEFGDEWDYVALGDSRTALADWPEVYSGFIEDDLDIEVFVHNMASVNQSSELLLASLRENDSLRHIISEAEIVTVWTGGNIAKDAMTKSYMSCDSTVVDSFGKNVENIIAEILKLRTRKYTIIHLIEFFQFRVEVLKELDILDEKKICVMEYNERINQVASRYDISVARIHLEFNGPHGDEDAVDLGYLIDDVHFSKAGDLFIAESLQELGYESLYSPDPKTNLIASCRSYNFE